jgi:hypothetical protein
VSFGRKWKSWGGLSAACDPDAGWLPASECRKYHPKYFRIQWNADRSCCKAAREDLWWDDRSYIEHQAGIDSEEIQWWWEREEARQHEKARQAARAQREAGWRRRGGGLPGRKPRKRPRGGHWDFVKGRWVGEEDDMPF